jgi:hypothetical protein
MRRLTATYYAFVAIPRGCGTKTLNIRSVCRCQEFRNALGQDIGLREVFMNRLIVREIAVALLAVLLAPGFLLASDPDPKSTETHLYATLVGLGSQAGAKGYVRNYAVTFNNTTTKQSHSLLSISARYLKLPHGSTVTFQLNGATVGTAIVREYNRAHLRLLTRKGDTVPTINAGDTLTVIAPDGRTIILTGTFVTGPDLH